MIHKNMKINLGNYSSIVLELMRHSRQLSTYVVICFCTYIVISKKEASQPQVESEG